MVEMARTGETVDRAKSSVVAEGVVAEVVKTALEGWLLSLSLGFLVPHPQCPLLHPGQDREM